MTFKRIQVGPYFFIEYRPEGIYAEIEVKVNDETIKANVNIPPENIKEYLEWRNQSGSIEK